MTTYRRNQKIWLRSANQYNTKLIPNVLYDYLYDYLGLTQEQARMVYHYAIIGCESDQTFYAADFKGICGLHLTRGKISELIYSLEDNPHFNYVRFKHCYFNCESKYFNPYKLHIILSEEQHAIISAMLNTPTDNMVPLSNTPISMKINKRKSKQKEQKPTIVNSEKPIVNSNIQSILDYMNSHRVNYALGKLGNANGINMTNRKIKYHATSFTDRIYSNSDTEVDRALPILNDRYVRSVLFKNTINIDIKSCQLYIVSKLLNLTELKSFLETNDFWNEMMDFTGIYDKRELKVPIYALIFGMMDNNLKSQYPAYRKLAKHPFIIQLLHARDNELKQLIEGKIITTAFGEALISTNRKEAKSNLNKYIVSYEQKIMLNLFEKYIINHKDFIVVGYLHDGIYVNSSKNKHFFPKYIEKIQETIVNEANFLGFNIKLENRVVEIEEKREFDSKYWSSIT